jgi:hypothetical protein
MSVVRLCLAAVLLAVVFAVLASVAPAATPGGAAYVPVGGSSGGVAISHGRVFLGLGDFFSGGFDQPAAIVGLGLDRRGGKR